MNIGIGAESAVCARFCDVYECKLYT